MTAASVRSRGGLVSLIVGILLLALGLILVANVNNHPVEWHFVESALLIWGAALAALGTNQLVG
jgi:multisubunit Na+/H+ antiporter MnhB subunit